jgi:hypothetical protein
MKGVEALIEQTRRKPNPKNRVDEATENEYVSWRSMNSRSPALASNELRKRASFVPSARRLRLPIYLTSGAALICTPEDGGGR